MGSVTRSINKDPVPNTDVRIRLQCRGTDTRISVPRLVTQCGYGSAFSTVHGVR